MTPRFPFGWYLPAAIAVATGLAIWADPSSGLAVAASVAAVVAAGFLFGEAWMRVPRPARPRPEGSPVTPARTVRVAFRSGRPGREQLLDLLDRIERQGPNPLLPARRIEEVDRWGRLSPTEFRRELADRLDELERMA